MKGLICEKWMIGRVARLQPLVGISAQTLRDEVQKSFVLRIQSLLQRLTARRLLPALAKHRTEQILARAAFHQIPVRGAKYLHDTHQLLVLILTIEDRRTRRECRKGAAEAPHINWRPIRSPQHYLWGAIKPVLDIRTRFLLIPTTGPEVDDANIRLLSFTEQNVLGPEIAVDDAFGLQQDEAGDELTGEAAY